MLAITVGSDPTNSPPRFAITVTGASGSIIQVARTGTDGRSVPVRGGDPGLLSGGEWIGYDYEAPFLESVTYTATDSVGSVSTIEPALGVTQSWLIHPGIPALSQPLSRIMLGDRQNDSGAAQHDILGRAAPIIVTDGVRKTDSLPLQFWTPAGSEPAMRLLVQDTATLLLQIAYPFTAQYAYEWVQVGQITVARVTKQFGDSRRIWNLACKVVDRPAGGIVAQRTWADVLGEAPTWDGISSQYATWGGVLTGIAGT